MKIDLRRAAAFHAVARAGGINAAARIEGRSPPSIHADFRRFERDAGVPLAERVGRRLRLTPEGRALYEAIDRALAEVAHAAEQVRSEAPAVVPLRIGCVTGFGRYRLAPRLFRDAESARRIVFRMGSHDQIIDWLGAGVIDLGVTYRGVAATPIESVAVAEEALWLIGAAGDPPGREGLSQMPCIVYDEYEYVFGRWFDQVLEAQPAALTIRDHCNELEEALLGVRAGRGFTIAPEDAARAFGFAPCGPVARNTLILCGMGNRLASEDARWIAGLAGASG
ncbi:MULTISPECIES: LysR family transcriptional regulator [unclassified Sphingomonas]|nr:MULTISPECIES: LysR family transcriptional regulator [unclassified Sphingomonas]